MPDARPDTAVPDEEVEEGEKLHRVEAVLGARFHGINKKLSDFNIIVFYGVGFGTTVNMVSKAGKGTILFIILALLMLPLVCVWVIAEEFTPIHLEIENQSLCAEQIRTDYEISLDDLDDVEILTELPNWSRVNGTGMETLEKGTFKISGEGECQVFLNPQNKKFLYFTANGKNYYMSGIDDTETEEIYQEILNQK